MKTYRVYPGTGFLIGEYTVGSLYIDPSWTMVDVQLPPNHGFIKPQFNFTLQKWQEGLNQSDINELNTPIYEEKIIYYYQYLMLRALSSSMGKSGSYEYLQLQKQEYEIKYSVAKGLTENTLISDVIEKEMLRDFPEESLNSILTSYGITPTGTHLEKMFQLIVFRYEYAELRYSQFKAFIIDFRAKCRTFVEQNNWIKLDESFSIVDALPTVLNDTEIEIFYNQFDIL